MTDLKKLLPKSILLFTLATLLLLPTFLFAQVKYQISFDTPNSYMEVKLNFQNTSTGKSILFMPVWTPGSYLIREYAKNVDQVVIGDLSGKTQSIKKITKNRWEVIGEPNAELSVFYRVYCRELSVRNAFVDDTIAYWNGAAVLLYPLGKEKEESIITIKPYKTYKNINTALAKVKNDQWTRKAENLDELMDAPVQLGSYQVDEFMAEGIPHTFAQVFASKPIRPSLIEDVKKIVSQQKAIFGEHPCKEYHFISHHLPKGKGGGGLEHSNSTVIQTFPEAYEKDDDYSGYLGLIAHEYFHLWNVKRLRPEALGPFDYENENYTTHLWVAEGFTAYYDDLTLIRAGLISEEKYLSLLSSSLRTTLNQIGAGVQSLSESSFDAWIKSYRPNENSSNTQISYYTKGSIIALMLDLDIISSTKGEKNLNFVLRKLYNDTYKKGRGFNETDLLEALKAASGKSYNEFFEKYVHGTIKPDLAPYLAPFGYVLQSNEKEPVPFSGMTINNDNFVTLVQTNSPAALGGVYHGDEILEVNGEKLQKLSKLELSINKPIRLKVKRNGFEKNLVVTPTASNNQNVSIVSINKRPGTALKKLRKKWLGDQTTIPHIGTDKK